MISIPHMRSRLTAFTTNCLARGGNVLAGRNMVTKIQLLQLLLSGNCCGHQNETQDYVINILKPKLI
jgi:hypothetical protein